MNSQQLTVSKAIDLFQSHAQDSIAVPGIGYLYGYDDYINLLYSHPVMQKVFAALDKAYTKNELLLVTPLVSGPFEFNGYLSSYKE